MNNRRGPQPALTPDQVHRKTSWLFFVLTVVVAVFIAPYRRTFKLYTWTPLKEIRAAGVDRKVLIPLVREWQADKYRELQSVQVAASFCAGAALSTLPWTREKNILWVADALWFSSLMCSIWAIITSIQTKSLLDDLPSHEQLTGLLPESEVQRMRRLILRYRKSPGINHWIGLFIWQFPSMAMAYAWCTFLSALTLYISTPFIRGDPWSDKHKIAICYYAVGGVGLVTYIFSTIFVYLGEKDYERSLASTRVASRANTIDPESSLASSEPDSAKIQQSSNGFQNTEPVQAVRERMGFNRIAQPDTESERPGRSKRQLLI